MSDLFPFEDPLRRCLRVEEWPQADRDAWEAALQPGDLLDGTVGAGFHWSEQTRVKYRKGYGRWLTFLITSERYKRDTDPASRITEEAVIGYIEELYSDVESWTLWGRLAELLAVAKVMDPDADWSWLRHIVRHFEGRVVASKNKLQHLRTASEISDWALNRMSEIIAARPPRDAESHDRDALMIGLLIACPAMRLGNLTIIEVGKHLIRMSEGYRLEFHASEMKNRKALSIPIPASLIDGLEYYLSDFRPALLDGETSDRLWITKYGKSMKQKTIYDRITKVTARAFGRPINPHLFRDCAVTTVALEDPAHIGIAAPILGHTDPRTTEQHYIQANAIVAGRRLRQSVDQLRKTYRARRRSKTRAGEQR